MKIGILGTGMVGEALATRFRELGHDVMMGARSASNEKARAWSATSGGKHGSFADAARHGEIVVNATSGSASLEALKLAGESSLAGKVLLDVANPLEFKPGMPPSLFLSNTDSLGEAIQRAFPSARVVKTLNTVNCQIMVHPERVPGTSVFVGGNDNAAKKTAADLLRDLGWKQIVDLGDITSARGTEQMLPLWLRLMTVFGSPNFNFAIVKA